MIPEAVISSVIARIGSLSGKKPEFKGHRSVSGGCIHNAILFDTSIGDYFVKWNKADQLHNFECEARGLAMLANPGKLNVSKVLGTGKAGGNAWILMEFIHAGRQKEGFYRHFGEGLAALHRESQGQFGLDHDNYIGSLVQHNAQEDSWPRFFARQRLQPQLKLAMKKGLVGNAFRKKVEALIQGLEGLFSNDPPSLLHGDLWSGNFMTGKDGRVVLIDPAVYFGQREAEIAFTMLFGRFNQDFYDAYNATWPLENGWESRVDLYNLYPLMVHLNLFGRSYLPEIQSILDKYS